VEKSILAATDCMNFNSNKTVIIIIIIIIIVIIISIFLIAHSTQFPRVKKLSKLL